MENEDFTERLRQMLSMTDGDDVGAIIQRLDVDGLLSLIDAVLANDEETVKKITHTPVSKTKTKIEGPAPKARNPVARELTTNPRFSTKKEVSPVSKDAKRDGWDRRAKHPVRDIDEAEVMFSLGDEVIVDEDKEATVKVPNGPNKTVGVLLDGKLRMVDSHKVRLKPVSEGMQDLNGVFGFNTMPSLGRIKTLAGMTDAAAEPVSVEASVQTTAIIPAKASPLSCALAAVEASIQDVSMAEFRDVVERLRALLSCVEEIGRAAICEGLTDEEPVDLGKTRNDAVNALQTALGGKPQNRMDAQKAFDQGRKDGTIVQKNGSFQQTPPKV